LVRIDNGKCQRFVWVDQSMQCFVRAKRHAGFLISGIAIGFNRPDRLHEQNAAPRCRAVTMNVPSDLNKRMSAGDIFSFRGRAQDVAQRLRSVLPHAPLQRLKAFCRK